MSKKNQNFLFIIILFFGTIALYSRVFGFSFINFDDDLYIYNNLHVQKGLTLENLKWAFTTSHGGHWHPLTWIAHIINVNFFKLEAGWHHAISIVFHSINALLLFAFLKKTTRNTIASFFVACIFTSHPLRLESVVWASQFKDVLSMFFALLCINAYSLYIIKNLKKYYIFALIAFCLGLLSKPTIIMIPFLLLLIDFWPLNREADISLGGWYIREKIPFFACSFLAGIATIAAQNNEGAVKMLSAYPFEERLSNVLVSYSAYIGKLFWPSNLAIFYPFTSHASGLAFTNFFLILLISFIAWQNRIKYPYIIFGWFWFLISFLPVIGIIQVGGQSLANRWTYLPHIGLIIACVFFLSDKIYSQKLLKIILTTVLTTLVLINLLIQPYWKNGESIFRYSIASVPDNFLAYMNLGAILDEQGKLHEAESYYQIAVNLRPTYSTALNNLGSIKSRLETPLAGKKYFEKAIAASPDFVPALYNLGLVHAYSSNDLLALYYWLKVLDLDADYVRAKDSLVYQINKYKNSCPTSNQNQDAVDLLKDTYLSLDTERLPKDLSNGIKKLGECFY
ncbi:MAG: hypothetical protein R3A13_00520 [Bdellovibrionota bacterium]